jgi:hypothetical protein
LESDNEALRHQMQSLASESEDLKKQKLFRIARRLGLFRTD